MNARDWRFPMACPNCDALAGTPHAVRPDPETLSLDLRCNACQHEWVISAPSPPVYLLAKLDRRRKPRPIAVAWPKNSALHLATRRSL